VAVLLLAYAGVCAASGYVKNKWHTPNDLDAHIAFVYTPQRHQVILRILRHFHTFCLEHDIPYWVCGGTLLGQQRCQGIIPFDDDADVAVPVEHVEFIKAHFVQEHPRFTIKTHNVPEFKVRDDGTCTPAFVDVFGVKMDESIKAYRFTQDAKFAFSKQIFFPEEIYPLQTVAFHDIEVLCMNNPRDYLTRTYGSTWNSELVVYLGHALQNQVVQMAALQFGLHTLALTDNLRDIMMSLAQQTTSLPDDDLDYAAVVVAEPVEPASTDAVAAALL
jgi:hypothetical protein